eukprot:COSAG02_NODE_3040_length_7491_cov_7.889205_2_plen_48_part_00
MCAMHIAFRYGGISSASFVDYLAMMGDAADGIPVRDSTELFYDIIDP